MIDAINKNPYTPLPFHHCIPIALITFDPMEGSVVFANELIASMLGYHVSEMLTKKVMDFDAHVQDLFGWQALAASLKHNGQVLTQSLYRKKNGDTIPVEISSMYCREVSESVVCAIHDISCYTKQTEEISISLQEKEHLLKEIHHRVKNNLQTISSLLSLGSKKIQNELALNALQDSQNRIQAIATVHEVLYKSDRIGRVDMSIYFKHLISSLIESFGSIAHDVKINMYIQNIFLVMDIAMPCGLIANELITNAIQHAFNADISIKNIDITMVQNSDSDIIFSINDNGVGFRDDTENKDTSVGLKLVKILVKQLNGQLEIMNQDGTEFRVLFSALDAIKGTA